MGNLDSLKMKVRAMPIFSNDSFTESDEEIYNPKRRISFNQNVHVFDMSKPAPKSPKRSKVITPILKQSPSVSSDEESEYLMPTKRATVPQRSTVAQGFTVPQGSTVQQRSPVPQRSTVPQGSTVSQSRNTGTMQSK